MRLDHVNIRTDDLDASTAFYCDILGLEIGPRPSFWFDGAWLYHDGQAVVHLKCPAVSNTEGAIEHVAFFTTASDEVVGAIRAHEIENRVQKLPDGSLRQSFLRDRALGEASPFERRRVKALIQEMEGQEYRLAMPVEVS